MPSEKDLEIKLIESPLICDNCNNIIGIYYQVYSFIYEHDKKIKDIAICFNCLKPELKEKLKQEDILNVDT